jgi:hypothetical protein
MTQTPRQGGQPAGQNQIRLEIPANLSAIFSNASIINQTPNEIVLDFVQIMPNDPRARVQSRIVMTPAAAKSFLFALQQNLQRYEQVYGEIKLPNQGSGSLADQLFTSSRPDDNA